MCGIVVQYFFNKSDISNTEVVGEMLDVIEHRGKDQRIINHFGNFTVGFRRLAITDVGENQPGIYGDWKIYLNGEVYNYKELGEGTECNVIARGFYHEGLNFVQKLNGMFLIVAIHNDEVYIIRDRYGIKPAYYFKTKDFVIVASEIKSILEHPKYEFEVDELSKKQWFTFNNVLSDATLFKGIKKVEKGTIMNLKAGSTFKYWSWKFTPDKNITYEVALRKVRELVCQAIKRQTPEFEFGCCLSSGIDSNILVAMSGDVYTFTAGFTEGVDERNIANKKGKKHYEIGYNKVRFFNETIYHLEDLRVGASWSNYGLYELASKYVKVLFDGAGADELFGGYSWRYKGEYYDVVKRTGIGGSQVKALFKQAFPKDTIEERYRFDADHFLEGVLLVGDKLSMAHTIEMRVPFLDNDLVDFCLTLPNEFKKDKAILKAAFADVLSEEILLAPKKGFSSPDWFIGDGNQAEKWASHSFNKWLEIFNK